MQNLEADGIITVFDIQTGAIVAQYEGLDVVRAIADKDAEIARLTSEVAELRRLGDGMAERLELFSFCADLVKRNPSALRADAIFEDNDAAALGGKRPRGNV